MSDWQGKHYAFFQNRACEHFPCHAGVPDAAFNCLFCWCPLYALGEACGGVCRYLTDGTKDCSACALPHRRENYGYIVGRFGELRELAKKKE